MEKKIYCLIGERCKCIKYRPQKNVSDSEMIRSSLKLACKTDHLLNIMMQGKFIILQKVDSDRGNKMCDIEDDEEIADKSDVNVLLISIPQTIVSDTISNVMPQNLKKGESLTIDANVLYIEPPEQNDLIPNTEIVPVEESSEIFIIEKIEKEDNRKENQREEPKQEQTGLSGIDNIPLLPVKTEKLPPKRGHVSIPYNTLLPPLTIDLEKLIAEDGINSLNQKNFIAHWASYLWNSTKGKPTKKDYFNLASSIIAAYPSLQDSWNGSGLVQKQLSVWIRNHRRNLKITQNNQGMKRNRNGSPKLPVEQAMLVSTEPVQKTISDIQQILKNLGKEYIEGKNVSHIKELLKMTLQDRRPWIENEAIRIMDIITKYPLLKDHEMIFYEFLNLKNVTEEIVFDAIKSMISKLLKYFSIQEENENSKILCMTKLYDQLSNKKLKKKYAPLFIVKEVMASTCAYLATEKGDAPRAVIYMISDKISCAYIVADKDIQMEIRNPSVEKVIAGLISSYFVWHRVYPLAYFNTLQYIEHEMLGTKINKNTILIKFIRDRNNHLKKDE